jgi:hypothetical protein
MEKKQTNTLRHWHLWIFDRNKVKKKKLKKQYPHLPNFETSSKSVQSKYGRKKKCNIMLNTDAK